MTEQQRKARNTRMLKQCWPIFARKVRAILNDLEGAGLRPRIQCAYRSPEDQLVAYCDGLSKVKWGFHCCFNKQTQRQEAQAVDILDDDNPECSNEDGRRFYLMLLSSAMAHGLVTGALFGLDDKQRKAIKRQASLHIFGAGPDLGWDPSHVEPCCMTLAQAKSGARLRDA